MTLGHSDAQQLERCIAVGGVAVFPADTVYGLACDPTSREAIARLYALKGRPADKPAAVMFFTLQRALDALHLATALAAEAATVVTFDPRLREAATSQGLFVAPPSA